jgi:signal recognition particle receptor subunit beta
MPMSVPITRDMNIRDKKIDKLAVTFFDLAGGERQRIFWRQHYGGSQGIIFMIDSSTPQYL